MKRNLLLFFFILGSAYSSFAQQNELGNWLMYFGQNRISDRLSIHSEVQYRNHTVAPVNIEQLLLRAGINYHFGKTAMASFGYGHISSHVYESEQTSPESIEHRIWQQLILTNKLSRIKFEHRYRIEQRWVNDDFRHRLRYRLMLLIPLNKPVIEPGTILLGLYDEIFVNTEQVFFDRNRLYAAIGYQVNQQIQVQLGALHQQVNDFGKFYLQFGLIFNPDFRKKE